MKITVLSYEGGILWGTARVKFVPNWIERLSGYKLNIKEYQWEGDTYWGGGERKWYSKKTGKDFGRFPEIDNYIRKRKYNRENKEMVVESEDLSLYNAFEGIDDLTPTVTKLMKEIREVRRT